MDVKIDKEKRGIEMKLAHAVHELDAYCQSSRVCRKFKWRFEFSDRGRYKGFPIVIADWNSEKGMMSDSITLTNPVSVYFSQYNKLSLWEVVKDWDWWQFIKYCTFGTEMLLGGRKISPRDIAKNLNIRTVSERIFRKDKRNLSCAEHEWWYWIERFQSDTWREDWYEAVTYTDHVDYEEMLRRFGNYLWTTEAVQSV